MLLWSLLISNTSAFLNNPVKPRDLRFQGFIFWGWYALQYDGRNITTAAPFHWADYAHLFTVLIHWREEHSVPVPCLGGMAVTLKESLFFRVPEPKKEKVCVFLLWATVPWLCRCHHVLGKYFDVILAFWRLIRFELLLMWKPEFCSVPMQSWARNEGLFQIKSFILQQWGKIIGLCLVHLQGIGNVTKYLHIHLHSVQYGNNI